MREDQDPLEELEVFNESLSMTSYSAQPPLGIHAAAISSIASEPQRKILPVNKASFGT